jgi:hypothetical protein
MNKQHLVAMRCAMAAFAFSAMWAAMPACSIEYDGLDDETGRNSNQVTSPVGGPITRAEIIGRAQYWFDRGDTWYSQDQADAISDGVGGSYRPDCSGFVSMAWRLPKKTDGWDLNTGDFNTTPNPTAPGYLGVQSVALNDLKPGDAILKTSVTHMELFDKWVNASDRTQGMWTFAERDFGRKTEHSILSWKYVTNNFRGLRYNGVVLPAPLEQAPTIRADFNGDGLDDVAGLYDYPGGRTVLFTWTATGGGGFAWPVNRWDSGTGGWEQVRSKPIAGDFNGDGLSDVGVFYDYPGGRTVLFTWSASGGGAFSGPINRWDSGTGGWEQVRSKPIAGDFNGDGLSDVGVFYDYPGGRTVLFTWTATGGGTFSGPINGWDSGTGGWEQVRSKPIVGDFDGNRLTDVGVFYDYPGGRTVLFTWRATGGGAFSGPINRWDSGTGGWEQVRSKPIVGDYNGDGITDVGVFYDYPGGRTVLFTWAAAGAGAFPGPVSRWDSGVGGWEQVRTKPL